MNCEAMGKKARIWHSPQGLMNGVVCIGDWFHLPLNPLRIQKLTVNYISSNAKNMTTLGCEMLHVHAREGLMETIMCFWDGNDFFYILSIILLIYEPTNIHF